MVKLLDTTLRDGSYVIDFQFTPADTINIGKAIKDTGVDFIEIGHGLGLGAGSKPHMRSPAPDEKYLEAAAENLDGSFWGMFFIPGIGRLEDIDMAFDYGMKFIRIGTDVDNSEVAEKSIQYAKQRGMYVASNFMKTYAIDFKSVAERALMAEKYGADIVCIVDSAGGMFPSDVEGYFNAIRDKTDIAVGFHGHNNLGLAMANTLKAVEIGCDVVDTSIRGMGRSAGNAVTEMFLFAMERLKQPLKIDVHHILRIAEEYIDPLMANYNQVNSIGIVSGFAQFHSSYLGMISQYAKSYEVDPCKLIIDVSNENKIQVTDELVRKQAEKLKAVSNKFDSRIYSLSVPEYHLSSNMNLTDRLSSALELLNVVAKKQGSKSVLNIVQANNITPNPGSQLSEIINEGSKFCVISVVANNISDIQVIIENSQHKVDYILFDTDYKSNVSDEIVTSISNFKLGSKLIRYSDTEIWAKATVGILLSRTDIQKTIAVWGRSLLRTNVEVQLHNLGVETWEVSEKFDVPLILFDKIPNEFLKEYMEEGRLVIDAALASINPIMLEKLLKRKCTILRPNMHPYILAELEARLGANQKYTTVQGAAEINDISIASGGWVASKGTVIVDNVNKPKKIFGIANGQGFLFPDDQLSFEFRKKLNDVQNLITNHWLE
jgi:4-hydroxy-2-oxovalerate aldolase